MKSILTINSGSSSVKACWFDANGSRRDFRYEHLRDPSVGFERLMQDLSGQIPAIIGHRFVHGGDITDAARIVDENELERLRSIIPLAPLHLPGNLLGVELCQQRYAVPQLACFDTAFHSTMPELAKRLPIPSSYGLSRYGFHGLSYAHIASVLPAAIGAQAYGKVVVAHLGSGASLCLMENLKSQDTTMGYTPAGGIVMGTRSGDLDPGVMLELAQHHDSATLLDIVFHKMGLLALSDGISSEMSELLANSSDASRFAVEYFCRDVRGEIASLAAKAGGIDVLVFTGGIGEHSAVIRKLICERLAFIGIKLDSIANLQNSQRIDEQGSLPVCVMPADEENMMFKLCASYLNDCT